MSVRYLLRRIRECLLSQVLLKLEEEIELQRARKVSGPKSKGEKIGKDLCQATAGPPSEGASRPQ